MSSGSHPRSSTEASNKRKASAKPTSSPSAIPEVAIAPQQKPERLLALMREHKQLLAKIKQKQSETSRLGRRIATAIAVAHQEAKPIQEKTARLERQIHDLFAELLAREGQPHGERTTVQLMYTYLEATGQISPAEQRQSEQESSHREDSENQIPPGTGGGVSAKRPVEGPAASTLRALFHRLAAAMHPDKVQDTHQKAERTEVMKELTQAFQAGDLARLLMLEREWLVSVDVNARSDGGLGADEQKQQCVQLEKRNQALRAQLKDVMDALRKLRRSPEADFLSNLKRAAQGREHEPLRAWIDSLSAQCDKLRDLLEVVICYRAGAIDVEDFEMWIWSEDRSQFLDSHEVNETEG